jgi:hypothetical protein
MVFEFDGVITRLEGKIKWSVIYFPFSASEHFGTKGNIPVIITVDGHRFEHTMLPSKNGHYIVYNEFIRRAVGKDTGSSVHITLEPDTKKRELVVPEYIKSRLQSSGVYETFENQPGYLKREQKNYIELAKKEETRANRISALIRRLGEKLIDFS